MLAKLLVVSVCAVAMLSGCGQRGPLYMPDKNARVVTRPGSAQAAVTSSAPEDSSAPSSAPVAPAAAPPSPN